MAHALIAFKNGIANEGFSLLTLLISKMTRLLLMNLFVSQTAAYRPRAQIVKENLQLG